MNDPKFEKLCEFDETGNCIHHDSPRLSDVVRGDGQKTRRVSDLEAIKATRNLVAEAAYNIGTAGKILTLAAGIGGNSLANRLADVLVELVDPLQTALRALAAMEAEETRDDTAVS